MDNTYFFKKTLSLVLLLALIIVGMFTFGSNRTFAGKDSAITVDTSSNNGTVNPFIWGVGAPDKYKWWAGNANLITSIRDANIKLVRVNPIQNMKYNNRDPYPAANTWSFTDMDSILNTIFDAGAEPLFTICGFPSGVPNTRDATGLITSADWNAYATFMTGVVKRYNTDKVLGATRTVKYWEMWNEPTIEGDGKFASQTDYKTFAQTVGNAMKVQDPTIKLIGPVDAWSNLSSKGWTSYAAKNLGSQFDILSWHDYNRDPTQSDATRMAWTKPHYQDNIVTVKSGGANNIFKGPTGKLYGAAITEYNMSYGDGGATYNPKYHNEFNAVYAASAMVNAMQGNADIFSVYNLAETGINRLGLLDNTTYAPYKPYYAFHMFGNHFGNQKLTGTGGSATLEFTASKDTTSGKTYVVVVNKDISLTYDVTINLNNISNSSGSVVVWKLDATTNPTSSTSTSYANSQFIYSIPSLTVISFEITPGSGTLTSTPTPIPIPTATPAPNPEPTKHSVDVFKSDIVNEINLVNVIKSKVAEANKSNVKVDLADIKGHWAEKTIDIFVKLQDIQGYEDGKFTPNGNITRAEFATIISHVFDISGASNSVALNDVGSHWAKYAINKLASAGVLAGYGDGTYKPDKTISREDMVIILSRIVNLGKLNKDAAKGNFSDIANASTYAANEIKDAAKAGIINGKNDGTFTPQGNATRAEALTVILNVLNLNPQVKMLLDNLN
jgi:hypothetical protein